MNKYVAFFLMVLFTAFGVLVLFWQMQLKKRITSIESKFDLQKSAGEDEQFELAPVMNRFQLYMNKLWFSGNAENWDLAEFYVHELEEAMNHVRNHQIIENGVKIHESINDWGLTPLKNLEKELPGKNKTMFVQKYDFLTTNCNSCHVATLHPFIKITRPQSDLPAFDNQSYY